MDFKTITSPEELDEIIEKTFEKSPANILFETINARAIHGISYKGFVDFCSCFGNEMSKDKASNLIMKFEELDDLYISDETVTQTLRDYKQYRGYFPRINLSADTSGRVFARLTRDYFALWYMGGDYGEETPTMICFEVPNL